MRPPRKPKWGDKLKENFKIKDSSRDPRYLSQSSLKRKKSRQEKIKQGRYRK